jgi:hypothetical protein
MIFDANGNVGGSYGAVNESPYELGLSGALMHVYETECNYNAMMKAVGLSELKYYQETGKDLFLNEAGAFGGFIEKAKALFKKIIEKIKAIFKKFMAKVNSYTASDKDFVKKYEKDILRKDISDMEFTGYEGLKNGYVDPKLTYTKADDITTKTVSFDSTGSTTAADSDALADQIETNRGTIIGGSSMTEAEFRDELHEKLYGDKSTFDVDSGMVRTALSTIKDTSKTVKDIEKEQKAIVTAIDKYIKALDKCANDFNKEFNKDVKSKSDDEIKGANNGTQLINNAIAEQKAFSNDMTVAFGMMSQAAKDANRQAKALCVKVLSYNKKESARLESGSDIFSNVTFA